ncbi:MAG: type II toxin-antitoxin system VapC family toxin [Acidobacteriia bacterium]|nr:type II toxin-antitoxin system VapC family toxin [Terriglobia bacterium]
MRTHVPVVWWATRVEVHSALERLRTDGAISAAAYIASKQRLELLLASWREIQPTDPLRDLACIQLGRFHLRASDALQLAAALVWCKQRPKGRLFVCNDQRLSNAAMQAGFDSAQA